MLVTSRLAHSMQYICHEQVPEAYQPNSILAEHTVAVAEPFITHLTSRQLSTSGLLVLDTHFEFREPATDLFTVAGESILMLFFLQGQADSAPAGRAGYVGNVHSLYYLPALEAAFQMPAHEPVQYFAIILSKAFYFRLLDQQCQLHQAFVAAVARAEPAGLGPTHRPITAEMHQLLHDIRHCTREGLLKRLFIEAKIRELLLLQLEQGQAPPPCLDRPTLRPDEQQKIEASRQLLESSYATPPTLPELARLVGLNEFKLKQGFRQQFGTSVRAYLIQFRLNKARQLLLAAEYSVGEVAALVGYKNGAHFTAAFKEKFGVLPSAVLR